MYFRIIRALGLLKWGLVCVLQDNTSFRLVVKVGYSGVIRPLVLLKRGAPASPIMYAEQVFSQEAGQTR